MKVDRITIKDYNKMKGIDYSYVAYYSNYSCYSKMEMSMESYLDFEAARASSVQ